MRIIYLLILLLWGLEVTAALKSSKSEYKLGNVANFEKITVPITLINSGETEIKLDAFRLSCGCATTDFKKGTVVSSKSTQIVNLIFEPIKMSGWVRKPIFVKYNENGKSKTLQLYLQAKVSILISMNPKIITFDDVSKSYFLTITNNSKLPMRELKLFYDKNYCSINPIPAETEIDPNSELKLEIKPTKKAFKQKRKFSKLDFSAKVGTNTVSLTTVIKVKQ